MHLSLYIYIYHHHHHHQRTIIIQGQCLIFKEATILIDGRMSKTTTILLLTISCFISFIKLIVKKCLMIILFRTKVIISITTVEDFDRNFFSCQHFQTTFCFLFNISDGYVTIKSFLS